MLYKWKVLLPWIEIKCALVGAEIHDMGHCERIQSIAIYMVTMVTEVLP